MQEAIENRGGDHVIAKALPPVAKALVTGQEDRAFFIPAADELKEEIGPLPVDGDIADLVDDEQLGDAVGFELLLILDAASSIIVGEWERPGTSERAMDTTSL